MSDSLLKNAPPLSFEGGRCVLKFAVEGEKVSVVVPKDPRANMAWRRDMIDAALMDPEFRATLLGYCAIPTVEGFLFFCNAFLYTFVVRKVDAKGREVPIIGDESVQPFITWPIQDAAAKEIIDCILNGGRILVDKSRDMGASWLVLAIFTWMFIFARNVNFMLMSYEKELVDNEGDMNALIPKIEFMLEHLPEWMVPPIETTDMKLVRADGVRNAITGKATTGKKGRGGRITAVLLDEAAFILPLRKLWVSLSRSTHCAIAVSTADGATYFSKLVRMAKSKVVRLMWWSHPEKGRGRYERKDESGALVVSSPWRDEQIRRSEDPLEISQEIDADDRAGGMSVFDSRLINLALAQAREHLYEGFIDTPDGKLRERSARLAKSAKVCPFVLKDASGRAAWLRVWCELEEDQSGLWRPNQDRQYAMGIDVGHGQGQANSTLTVVEIESGRKVAEGVSAHHDPAEWALACVMVAHWFGGRNAGPFMMWDSLGIGGYFGRCVRRLKYGFYYMRTDEEDVNKPQSGKPGFPTTARGKQIILPQLEVAWKRGEFFNPSQRAIEEANAYVWYESGDAGMGEREDESTGARAAHGDIVIADALAWHAAMRFGRQKPHARVPVPGTVAYGRGNG